MSTGMPKDRNGEYRHVYGLAASGAYLLALTDSAGVWRRPLSQIVVGTEPARFVAGGPVFRPNVPNPFSGETEISFTLSAPTNVYLAVYDVTGRCVAVLVNGVTRAGTHRVTFDSVGLPEGVYLSRLGTPGGAQTRPLLLVR